MIFKKNKNLFSAIQGIGFCLLILFILYRLFFDRALSVSTEQKGFLKHQFEEMIAKSVPDGEWKGRGQIGQSGFILFGNYYLYKHINRDPGVLIEDILREQGWTQIYFSSTQRDPYAIYCNGDYSATITRSSDGDSLNVSLAYQKRISDPDGCQHHAAIRRLALDKNELGLR
ncbi:hypothetical protein KDM88_15390 [Undibacterium sp. BYS50W]|nr:hypothetical protein [Undibacterium rugosum]